MKAVSHVIREYTHVVRNEEEERRSLEEMPFFLAVIPRFSQRVGILKFPHFHVNVSLPDKHVHIL